MIVQPPTTPRAVPYTGGADIPVAYIRRSSDVTQARLDQILAQWARIPAALVKPYLAWHSRPTWAVWAASTMSRADVAFHIYLESNDGAFDQFGGGFGRRPGDMNWAGVYNGLGFGPSATSSTAWRVPSDYPQGLVHEFGHHIDFTHNRILGNGALSLITDSAPWSTWWSTHRSSIPTTLYGSTNIREWFAEMFMLQITRSSSDESVFLALAGGQVGVAQAIRRQWRELLPALPAWPAFD